MERFEFFCPIHGITDTRYHMDARLDPSKCRVCGRMLRFSLEGEVTRHFTSPRPPEPDVY